MTLPWRRKQASGDSTGVSNQASHIALNAEHPGVIFLKLKRVCPGGIQWTKFIELSPEAVAELIEELTEAHAVAIRAEVVGMENR